MNMPTVFESEGDTSVAMASTFCEFEKSGELKERLYDQR